MTFDLSLYNEDFFLWHHKYVRESSIRAMNWYIKEYGPKSVIDFGCGIGSYLEPAFDKGLKIQGYDISDKARKYTPDRIAPFIEYRDCTKRITTGKFDCVISFETAEHIEPSGTDQFVDNILQAVGERLLFTAAPPGQLGTGHINLQPKEFWMDKFKSLINLSHSLGHSKSSDR